MSVGGVGRREALQKHERTCHREVEWKGDVFFFSSARSSPRITQLVIRGTLALTTGPWRLDHPRSASSDLSVENVCTPPASPQSSGKAAAVCVLSCERGPTAFALSARIERENTVARTVSAFLGNAKVRSGPQRLDAGRLAGPTRIRCWCCCRREPMQLPSSWLPKRCSSAAIWRGARGGSW